MADIPDGHDRNGPSNENAHLDISGGGCHGDQLPQLQMRMEQLQEWQKELEEARLQLEPEHA